MNRNKKYQKDLAPMALLASDLPQYPLPDGFEDGFDFLSHIVRGKTSVSPEVYDRLAFELDCIKSYEGFANYLLIVWDLVLAAKERFGLHVGPGRSSTAGSLVCCLLGITKINPLEHGLLFERFFCLDREEIPVIGIDVEYGAKDILTDYLKEKYGRSDFVNVMELQSLSQIHSICRLIEKKGLVLDIDNIPLDDRLLLEAFARAETQCVFGFESRRIKDSLVRMGTIAFNDLVALYAMYRPGLMEYIPEYLSRCGSKQVVSYPIPCMEGDLKETKGMLVYQEQLMSFLRESAGFSRADSEKCRRLFWQKDKSLANYYRKPFIEGGVGFGYSQEALESIWVDWCAKAPSLFVKSHAVCYTYIAYQMMYLKVRFPNEFYQVVGTGC